jgi:hypothetical protein
MNDVSQVFEETRLHFESGRFKDPLIQGFKTRLTGVGTSAKLKKVCQLTVIMVFDRSSALDD